MGRKPKPKTKDQRVEEEYQRLLTIFETLTPDEKGVCDGLMWEAARLRIMLDDAWVDIEQKGDVELFSQSSDVDPYERLRPVAQLYNTRNKNYQTIIKQLCDRLPDGGKTDDAGNKALGYVRERGGT